MREHPIANGSRENIAHLSHSLETALGQNRILLEDMVRFTRDESLRLARMQLDHAGNAFAQLHDRHDLSALVRAQQEWIKQAMNEYAALGLRYAEMVQGLTQQVHSHVQAAASDLGHQATEGAQDLERHLERNMPQTQSMMNNGHSTMPAE
jgi:hypothetical protein